MMPLLFAAALLVPAQEEIDFKRVFKANDVASYTVLTTVGQIKMGADITTHVKSITVDGATVNYKVTKFDMPMQTNDPLPDITTKVGAANMPNSVNILNAEEFFIFLGMASITPGTKAKVGGEVKVSWQNDRKDVSVDGLGKIEAADKDAKTMTVQWTLTLRAPKGPPSTWKLKSLYSTPDFSLVSSEGPIEGLGADMRLKVARKTD